MALDHVDVLHGPATDRALSRGAKTREKLLQASWDLFGTRGYEGTSIGDVARLAGVGVGTVYHHFRDKRAILLELLESYEGTELISDRETGSGGLAIVMADENPRLALVAYLRMAVELRRRHPSLEPMARDAGRRDSEVLACCERVQSLRCARLRRDIEQGQRLGVLRGDISPHYAALMIHAALKATIAEIAGGPAAIAEGQIEVLADLLTSYLFAR